jgi:ribosomal protein S6--L-glutamate ligase
MKIAIITTGQIHEDKRLVEAAESKGHQIDVLKLKKCSVRVCPEASLIYYEGKDISQKYDIIIPRLNVSHTDYGMAILRQFQAMDVYVTDTAYSIELGRDKLRCLQYLLRHGVPFPKTGFADSKDDFDNIITTIGGTPLVIKLIEGTEGTGVFLVDDVKQAGNIMGTCKQFDTPIIVQEFIAESAGTDLRCFVVGDKVVATMKRESQDGDFRANVSLGGHSSSEVLSQEEEEIALKAAQAIGLNIAGVDMIRSNAGPLIIEINVSPDFCGEQGIESVTGVDVAGAIIDYAVAGKKAFDKGEGVWLQQASQS